MNSGDEWEQPAVTRHAHAIGLVTIALLAPLGAAAETGPPENDDARYSFNQVDGGYLRLDGRTGQVSLCNRHSIGWTCQTVPDERAALEGEIARLQGENAALKQALVTRNLPLPGTVRPAPSMPSTVEQQLPRDPDPNMVVGLVEKIWRRLVEMIVQLQKDMGDKT
jgi:hypothetical protein